MLENDLVTFFLFFILNLLHKSYLRIYRRKRKKTDKTAYVRLRRLFLREIRQYA